MENDLYKTAYKTAEKEYYFLQTEVGRYDGLLHGIKNWSITASFAIIATGFAQQNNSLFLLSALAVIIFWHTEAKWKRFQHIHIDRIKKIEKFLDGSENDYVGPGITAHLVKKFTSSGQGFFTKSWVIFREELYFMFVSNVRQPHTILVLVGLTLFIFNESLRLF